MTANTQTRYDFGRVTVEHVGPHDHTVPVWGTDSVDAMSKRGVVLRVKQSHWQNAPDEALLTLLDVDARALAKDILEALGENE